VRADVAHYELREAESLADVLDLLAREPGVYRPMAGGTDVMVVYGGGKLVHTKFIDIWGLSELRGIEVSEAAVTLGALTTYSEVQAHPVLVRELPMLCQAASETGGWAIQNRGTLGGNIANASPAADTPPALLAYDAALELSSKRGVRWVSYASFHTGYKTTVMERDEIVTRVRIPRLTLGKQAARIHMYRKVGPRKAQAISKVSFAASIDMDGKRIASVRIALGGVAPVVLRVVETERALLGVGADVSTLDSGSVASVVKVLAREIAPVDDIRSTARYRRRVAENLFIELTKRLEAHVGLDPKAR
jgi:CO/xanthine dehydrogenase FAD-binding subunit